ncbi:tRNA (adenine(58)-N(1))-methyltransferase non-catalytic subunit trm6 [Ascosphaera aggregata]|nr:tRNA (adenine(58)-N(1))-methyltransferase non-catalytic subunit trm6 [Ascosphaera aggregata]
MQQQQQQQQQQQKNGEKAVVDVVVDKEQDFPLDPTLLFGPTVQTSRARAFQVLPGRTHPTMTARGGAVGYIFHAIRGLAAEGKVTARGQVLRKKRKTESASEELAKEVSG